MNSFTALRPTVFIFHPNSKHKKNTRIDPTSQTSAVWLPTPFYVLQFLQNDFKKEFYVSRYI